MGPEPNTPGNGAVNGQTPELAVPFFYHTSPEPLPYGWEPFGIYQRSDHAVLGDEDNATEFDTIENPQDTSRCFNCGNPDHKIPDCPFRLDRDLIALSRQYYQFFQGTIGLGKFQRIHTVEASRQERLNWLEEFEPGRIQGELLKEALESSNEEWLKNISLWGYPPGWITETDPRDKIISLIWEENYGNVENDLHDESFFEIHGDEDVIEAVSFRGAFQAIDHSPRRTNTGNTSSSTKFPLTSSQTRPGSPYLNSSSSESESIETGPSPCPPPRPIPSRWANYPLSYFSSQHLIPYVPPFRNTETWSSTLFENTESYLHQFHSQPPPPPAEEPPPLPPSEAHPPLPPTSIPLPPPALPPQCIHPTHCFPAHRPSPISNSIQIDAYESDMELSDLD